MCGLFHQVLHFKLTTSNISTVLLLFHWLFLTNCYFLQLSFDDNVCVKVGELFLE